MKLAAAKITVTIIFLMTMVSCGSSQKNADQGIYGKIILQESFEEEKTAPTEWTTMVGAINKDRGTISEITSDSLHSHHGRYSLKLSGDINTSKWMAVINGPFQVQPDQNYILSGWMMTENVRIEGNQKKNSNLFIRFTDSDGKTIQTSSGYPVTGTRILMGSNDWIEVTKYVRAPQAAFYAEIGCFLSCSGAAWFDDIRFGSVMKVEWIKKETERFTYYYEGDDVVPDDAIHSNEDALKSLEDRLGIKHKGIISYYKYDSLERKELLTGVPGNVHNEIGAVMKIHSIFWYDNHEIVHILTSSWGEGTALLAEGVAVYFSGGWHRKPVDYWGRKYLDDGSLIGLDELILSENFRNYPDNITYPEAGSYVKFLIETYGIEPFRKLYGSVPSNCSVERFKGLFNSIYEITSVRL